MAPRRKTSDASGELSFAITPLEPRLLLSAEWALGLAPDDPRSDPFELDSLSARRVLDMLSDGGRQSVPASIDLGQFLILHNDANGPDDSAAAKPDPRNLRLQSGDAPDAVDDNVIINEDEFIAFSAQWFDPEWTVRRELTIDNSASGTELTDFPILVVLDSSRIDYALTEDRGDDLRFTDAAGNLLDYEIELWDETGTSYVWVRVDSIAAGSSSDSIFMYYGNDSVGGGDSPRDVWGADFAQVQHFEETSGRYDDSTSNNVDIDLEGGDSHGAATFIGPAHEFDGTNQLDSDRDALQDNSVRGTLSLWAQFDSTNGVINLLDSDVQRDQALWTSNGVFQASMWLGAFDARYLSGGSIEAGWNQVVFSWDSATGDLWLYVNGVLVDQDSGTPWNPIGVSGTGINIGGDANVAPSFLPNRAGLDGAIDELRVSSVVRSADWIAAQYAAINDTVISYGSEESVARGVLANDTDAEDDPLRVVLETGPSNADSFTLFSDGSFEYRPVADFVGTDSFTYRADDGSSLSAPATVTITVNPVNDAPTFVLAGTQNVVEDGGPFGIAGFSVATPGGGPDEAGQTFTYVVTTDSPGMFSVAPSIDAAGTLTYTLAPDANGTANIEVKMTDSGGDANGGSDTAASAVFAINVAPVNDAPLAALLGDQTVAQNAGPQTIAGFATGMPGGGADELGQNLIYTVTTDQPALFSAAPAISPGGALTFTFANGAFGVANVEVVVTDSGGTASGGDDTSDTYTFTLTATPTSVPPTASNMNQVLNYLEDNPLAVDNIVVSDADSGDTITATLTLANPLAGSLSALTGSGETYVAATGRWRITGTLSEVNTALAGIAFVPSANYAENTSISVRIEDAAGTGPADGLISLRAVAINDAPTIALAGNVVIAEDAGPQTIAGFATAFAGGGSDESGQTFSYDVTADQPALFSVAPTIAPDGTLSFTANDNATGNVTLSVRVTDSGGTSNGGQNQSIVYQFDIAITSQPDAPVATNTTQTIVYTEDAGAVSFTPIIVSDNDTSDIITATLTLADPLAGVLSSGSGAGETYDASTGRWQVTGTTAQVNGALVNVTFVANANVARDTSIAVSIEDAAGNGPSDGVITLNAAAINDAPSAALLGDIVVAENAGPQTITNFANAFAGGGDDEAAQTFTYSVTTDTPALFSARPAIAPNGTLTFTALDNEAGVATVRVRVTDSGDTANGGQNESIEYVFNIIVSAVSDAPTATNTTQALSYIEDGSPIALAAIVVSDSDPGDQVTATLTLNDPQAGSLSVLPGSGATWEAANGRWQVTGTVAAVNAALADVAFLPGADYARDTSIVVRIEDAAGSGPADGLITLSAVAVNDAPVASPLSQLQRFIEDAATIALDDISVTDADSGDTVTATLALGNPDAGLLSSASGHGESYDAASGIWRVSGSAEQVSAALAAVVFAPAADFAGDVSIVTRIVDETGLGPPPGEIRLEATAVNDAPVVALAGDISTLEDAPLQRVVGFAMLVENGGTDEQDQSLLFDVSTDNPALFRVLPTISAEGELVYEVAPDANGLANVTVVARDDGGRANGGDDTAAAVTFNVQIDPVNDAPTSSNRFVVAPPSGIAVLTTSAFGFADPTDGDGFDGVFITTLPAQGQLLLNGQPLNAGDFVSAQDIDANRLTLATLALPGDSLLLNFDFLVRDSGGIDRGGSNLAEKTSTVTVAVDVADTTGTGPMQNRDEAEAEETSAAPNEPLSAEEILAAEPTLPEVDVVYAENLSALPPLPPSPVDLPSLDTAPPDIETAIAPAQQAVTTSPAVTRVLVTLLENVRNATLDATFIEASITTPLAADTDGLVKQLSELRDEALTEQATGELVIMQSSAVAFGLSVGYVSWLLRGGVLLSSMLTSLPAWRFIDPLPIFSGNRQQDEYDESLQDIVSTRDERSSETGAGDVQR